MCKECNLEADITGTFKAMTVQEIADARADVANVLRVQEWGGDSVALADDYIEYLRDADECDNATSAGEWLTETRMQRGGVL